MLRKIPLQNGHYYHIYNHGVEKIEIFRDKYDYIRFLTSMREFNRIEPIGSLYDLKMNARKGGSTAYWAVEPLNKLVEIICYSLIPNHKHMILKQLVENGISEFIKRLAGGYTWYFNNKYKRSGSLFQGKFKSAYIKSDEKLWWLSGYVNCNAEIHKITKAENWIWSSYSDYLGIRRGTLCNQNFILDEFSNIDEYKKFCQKAIKEAQQHKDDLKELLLE